jgi:very-short-patch-repair endonuclease
MRGPHPWRTNRSRVLRATETSAEAKLWSELRNRRLAGFKFVRQAPLAKYYVDFLCRERKVVVEVDGATHSTDTELEYDARREEDIRRLGYRVSRATNTDLYENIDGVLDELLDLLEKPV